jgi:hypothetical protein
VIAQMVDEMVLKFGDEIAFRTGEHLVRLNVLLCVLPVVVLLDRHIVALFAAIFAITSRIRTTSSARFR